MLNTRTGNVTGYVTGIVFGNMKTKKGSKKRRFSKGEKRKEGIKHEKSKKMVSLRYGGGNDNCGGSSSVCGRRR